MPFGATAAADGVRFAVWAPSANEAAVEIGGRRVAMERAAQGFYLLLRSRRSARRALRLSLRHDRHRNSRPGLALQSRRRSRTIRSRRRHGVRMARRRLARAPLGRSRHLRAARRHVYARRNLRRSRRAARLLGRARREYDRAHASRGDSRPLELGLRRRAAIRAARRIRPSRRPEALRRCGSCTRPRRCCSTWFTTTSGPTAIISATTHPSSSRRATRHRGATP